MTEMHDSARMGEIEDPTSATTSINISHSSSPSLSPTTLPDPNSTGVNSNFSSSVFPVQQEQHQIQLILDPQVVAGVELDDQQHQLPVFESIFYDPSSGSLLNTSAMDETNSQLLYSTEFIVQDGQVILAGSSNPVVSDNQLCFQEEQQPQLTYQYFQSPNELQPQETQISAVTSSCSPELVSTEGVVQEAASPVAAVKQHQIPQINQSSPIQSRRRARKSDLKGLAGFTETETQSLDPQVETSASQIAVKKNNPKNMQVRKPVTKSAIQQSCLRLGFLSPSKASNKKPFYIPPTIYRLPDEQRNLSVLPPGSVVLRFSKLDKKKRQKSSAFLTANLLASNGETFRRVLLGADIENISQKKSPLTVSTLLLQNEMMNPVDDPIPASDLVIPRHTLIIRHPLLRRDQASPVYCVFPVEKVGIDGSRQHEIHRTVIQRSIEAGQIQIHYENVGKIQTYLGSLPPSENGMEHNNQLYNCYFPSNGSLHTQPATENRNPFPITQYAPAPPNNTIQAQLFPSGQQARVLSHQGINSPIQQSNYGHQQLGPVNIIYTLQSQQMPLAFISHQQQQIDINYPPVQHANTNNIHSSSMVINNNVQAHHNNHININPMKLVDNAALAPANPTAVPGTSAAIHKKPRAKPKPQPKVKVQELNVINSFSDVSQVSQLQGTSVTNNNLIHEQSNQTNTVELSNYNGSISQALNVPQNSSSLQAPQNLPNANGSSCTTGTPWCHTSRTLSPVRNPTPIISQLSAQVEQSNFQTNDIITKSTIQGQLCANEGFVETEHRVAPVTIPINQGEEMKPGIRIKQDEQLKEEDQPTRPRFIQGFVARCKRCGICSDDLYKCTRCKFAIPKGSKIIKDSWGPKTQIPMTSSSLPSSSVVGKGQSDPSKSETLKRGHTKKIKSETPATSRTRGGGRRQEECKDEFDEPKAKILKPENEVAVSTTTSPSSKSPSKSGGNPQCPKSVQINLIPVDRENSKGIPDNGEVKSAATKKIFNMTPLASTAIPLRPESDTDPEEGQCQKYITFLADEFNDSDVAVMKTTYGESLQEVDYIRANEHLMNITPAVPNTKELKTSDKQIQTTDSVPENGSSRLTSTTEHIVVSTGVGTTNAEPVEVDCSENKQLLNFEEVAICQNDVLRLANEQFLNDSLLDFWMRYIQYVVLSPVDRDRTYMFSTFFYTRLTTRPRPKRRAGNEVEDPNLSNAEKRHADVKRWTKKVDIFQKDFIFIPINENYHWFMAVICYPGLLGVHNLETGEPIPDYNKRRGKGKGKAGIKTVVKVQQCNGDNGSGSSSQMDDCAPKLCLPDQTNSKAAEVGKVRIKQPCILILDSLAGEPRSRVYSTIREYLKMEYKTKKGVDRDFNEISMPGVMPNVPQQPNLLDCGIFTLFYVECFFQKPIISFDIPIEDGIPEWKKIRWEGKREEIYNVVRQLVEKQNPDYLKFVPTLTFDDLSEMEIANRRDTDAESGTYSYSRLSGENMTETSSSSTSMDRKTYPSHIFPDFKNSHIVSQLEQFLKSDCEEARMLFKELLSDRDIRKKLWAAQNEFEDKKDLSILKIRFPTALVSSVLHSSKDDGKAGDLIVNQLQEILNGLEHKCESKLREGVDQFKDWSNEMLKLLQKDGDCEELTIPEILQVIKTHFAKLRMLEMRLGHEGDQWKGVTAKSFLQNLEASQSSTELLELLVKLANLVMGRVE